MHLDAIPFTSAGFHESRAGSSFADASSLMHAEHIEMNASISPFDASISSMTSEAMFCSRASKGNCTMTKGIASTSIEITVELKEVTAWAKEIDAAMSLMRDETKVIPSRATDARSTSKGMRYERTDETGATFGFFAAPTCFTATRKELDAGLDAFQAGSIGMSDEVKSFSFCSYVMSHNMTCVPGAHEGYPRARALRPDDGC